MEMEHPLVEQSMEINASLLSADRPALDNQLFKIGMTSPPSNKNLQNPTDISKQELAEGDTERFLSPKLNDTKVRNVPAPKPRQKGKKIKGDQRAPNTLLILK